MPESSPLDLSTRVRRAEGIFAAEIGSELAMLSVDRGRYYSLNATASAIWRGLEHPAQVAELCAELRTIFEVDPETCEEDTLILLRELLSEGLVRIAA